MKTIKVILSRRDIWRITARLFQLVILGTRGDWVWAKVSQTGDKIKIVMK